MVKKEEKLLLLFINNIFELKIKSYLNINLDFKSLRFMQFLDEWVKIVVAEDVIMIYLVLLMLRLI
jgi:hypothetical protein